MLLRTLILAAAFAAGPALAAEILVTTAADDGAGSLRAAVATANATPGADVVTIAAPGTIALTGGTILVTDDVTVRNAGSAQAIVRNDAPARPVAAFDPGRVFLVRGTVERRIAVALQGLVMSNGRTRGTEDAAGIVTDAGEGGAVRSIYADLVIDRCTFSDNRTVTDGGALWHYDGDVVVRDSHFSANTAALSGGGAHLSGGTMRLERVRFHSNSALSGGALATIDTGTHVVVADAQFEANRATQNGGGGYLALTSLSIARTTFNANVSEQPFGAGVYLVAPSDAPGTPMVIANSTFSGNASDHFAGAGAGITLAGGRLLVRNSTVFGNRMPGSGGGTQAGGGILVRGGGNHLELESVLVAGNTRGDAASDLVREIGEDGVDNTVRARHSLIQAAPAPGTLNAGDAENLFAIDPLVAPLAHNGGYAPTHAIAPNSPARERGDNVFPLLTTDQRGVDATLGVTFNRYYDRPDIGAYEYFGEDTIFYADLEDH